MSPIATKNQLDLLAIPHAALELIEGFEGFRSKPYRCPAGVWTDGYGFTSDLHGAPVTASTPAISQPAAAAHLLVLMKSYAAKIIKASNVRLNANQLGALISLGFNIGFGALTGSTLWKRLQDGDVAGAAAQFPAWNRGGGKVLPGLVARRAAEQKLFLTPIAA